MPTKSFTSKKEAKRQSIDVADNLAGFTLPDSLPCSEVDFPILIKKKPKVSWKAILEESDEKSKKIKEYEDSKIIQKAKSPFLKTESDYIQYEVFQQLLPALEETLNKARLWNVFESPKSFFNGVDHIAQLLWNNNPRYPARSDANLHLFNMPWVRKYLAEHPRPLYPKSWLWPEEYAATLIQKTFRQYLIQRDEEVQEMREFWKKLAVERSVPDLVMNPFLAKKFASEHAYRQKQPEKKENN